MRKFVMAIIINVQEAKTRLSELLRLVQDGEKVIIARAGVEIASLEPLQPKVRKLNEPLLPGFAPIDVMELVHPIDAEEVAKWDEVREDDPLFA